MYNSIRFNKYLPVALIYFFLNAAFLPLGLLYTSLLCPFFLFWLHKQKRLGDLRVFFLISIPFFCIHLALGIQFAHYARSYMLLLAVFVFTISCMVFCRVCVTLRDIFRQLLIINFLLVLLACIALFFPAARGYFWSTYSVSAGLEHLPRLRLFTYEPSYYSSLLVPLVFYYYLKLFFFKLPNKGMYLVMVSLPLLLSFSLGVLMGLALSFFFLFFANIRSFFMREQVARYALFTFVGLCAMLIALSLFYPTNPLFLRVANIFHGSDTSFRGRAFDSFYLAWRLAMEKSLFFGVGLGQVKLLGVELWSKYYNTVISPGEVTIPNAVAETLAISGIAGLVIRFSLEAYLFVRTKVHTNYYRMGLFVYIFIYQFTGSFLFNVPEYVIWVLAFSRVFEEFNKTNVLRKDAS